MSRLAARYWTIRSLVGQHLWPLRRGKLSFIWRRFRNDWERVHVVPSEYSGHISVWDLGRERRLIFDEWLDLSPESVIFRSGDWDELRREYWGEVLRTPRPIPENPSVLIFGLGGGTLVHLANQMLEPSKITVVELDPAVVEVAKEFMGLKSFDNVRYMTIDALSAIEQLEGNEVFDFVIEDCFYEGMADKSDSFISEYIRSQASLLSDDGILVFNRLYKTWTHEPIDADQERLEKFLKEQFSFVERKQVEQRWLNELFFACDLKPVSSGSTDQELSSS